MSYYFKADTLSLKSMLEKLSIIKGVAHSMQSNAKTFKTEAYDEAGTWVKRFTDDHTEKINIENYRRRNNSGIGSVTYDRFAYDRACMAASLAAQSWVQKKVDEYKRLANNYDSWVADFVKRIDGVYNALSKVLESMNTLKDTQYNLTDAIQSYDKWLAIDQDDTIDSEIYDEITEAREDLKALGFQEKIVLTTDGKAETVVEAVVDNDQHGLQTLVEGTRANVDYNLTTTGGAVVIAAYGGRKGWTPQQTEQKLRGLSAKGNKTVENRLASGAYSDGTPRTDAQGKPVSGVMAKVADIYEETFEEEYTYENFRERKGKVMSALGEDDLNLLSELQARYLGATGSDGSPVFNSMLTDRIIEEPKVKNAYHNALNAQRVEVDNSGIKTVATPSISRPTSQATIKVDDTINSYTPLPTMPDHSIPKTQHIDVDRMIQATTSTDIPKIIDDKTVGLDIDAQAKEIYYSQNPQELAANRANALSAVEDAFDGKNVKEFKDVLKQGGFDDVDVDYVMENKEVAVTAYILASESKNLTEIANKLAAANNIANFDTIYDNGISRMQLENGMSASKLMADVDDDVVEARTNVQNARTKYKSSVKRANDSIEDATKKKEEMEELRRRIVKKSGEDTSKWDDDDIEAYNKAIEKYNEANKLANEAHKDAMKHKGLLEDAETRLSKIEKDATDKYMDEVGKQEVEGVTKPFEEGVEPISKVEKVQEPIDDMDKSRILSTSDFDSDLKPDIKADDSIDINLDDIGNGNGPTHLIRGTDEFKEVNIGGRKLDTEDVLSLFDDLDDVATISDADRTLDSFDLNAVTAGERVLPGTELSDVISGKPSGSMGMGIIPHDSGKATVSSGNSLVDLADSVSNEAADEMNSFQDLRFNSLDNGYVSIEENPSYTSNESDEEEEPEKPRTRESESSKDVAGVQVEKEEAVRHTDGVLVEDQVASEVSDDGRSLEYVEID